MSEEQKDTGMKVVELPPEPKPEGPTLGEALAEMSEDLAVEPVSGEPNMDVVSGADEELHDEVLEDQVEDEESVETVSGDEEPEEEVEEELEEELGEEPEEEPGTFTLQVGEVELELDVDDPETRAALEAMQNDLERVRDIDDIYTRVEQQSFDNAAAKAELDEIEEDLRTDPVGYITERVNPKWRIELVKELLFDDQVLAAVEEQLNDWMDDPAKRREAAADLKVQRLERQRERDAARVRLTAERRNAQQVWNKLKELTPADMDHQTAKMFHRDAMMEIRQYVAANNIETLNPDDLPKVLAHRMRLYGIGENVRRKPAQPTDDRGKELASDTGERFRKKVARRKRVASAPAGVGGTPSRPALPKGATLDDALKSLEARTG